MENNPLSDFEQQICSQRKGWCIRFSIGFVLAIRTGGGWGITGQDKERREVFVLAISRADYTHVAGLGTCRERAIGMCNDIHGIRARIHIFLAPSVGSGSAFIIAQSYLHIQFLSLQPRHGTFPFTSEPRRPRRIPRRPAGVPHRSPPPQPPEYLRISDSLARGGKW